MVRKRIPSSFFRIWISNCPSVICWKNYSFPIKENTFLPIIITDCDPRHFWYHWAGGWGLDAGYEGDATNEETNGVIFKSLNDVSIHLFQPTPPQLSLKRLRWHGFQTAFPDTCWVMCLMCLMCCVPRAFSLHLSHHCRVHLDFSH